MVRRRRGWAIVGASATALSLGLGTLSIYAQAGEASPDADTVMPEVIVDNNDPGFSTTGTWTSSTGSKGYHGRDYLYAAPGTGKDRARWTPSVPKSGTYGVYYWLPAGNSSRTDKAPFTVHGIAGDHTYEVNEKADSGGNWVLLANHEFRKGTDGYIEVSNSSPGFVNADAIKLGQPGQLSIETQIARATAAGKKEVTILPGTYRRTSTLSLSRLNNFTINAYGVTIVQKRLVQAVSGGSARDLTVKGLTINYDPLPFTQGKVTKKSADGTSMEVQIFQGYSRPEKLADRVTIWRPDVRLPKSQKLGASVSWVDRAAGIAQSNSAGSAVVGDIVTFAGGAASGAAYGITADGANTTLKDVTLHAAPGMGLMNSTGEGNMHLDNFRIVPGPPPPGATEKPILTSTWDAIQFQAVKKGPTIENSRIENAGDDSVSNPGIGVVNVRKVDGNTVWVDFDGNVYRVGKVGDRLQRWAGDTIATIKGMERETDSEITKLSSASGRSDSMYRVTLDKPSPWAAGTQITDIDRMGNGFVFRNNYVDSSGRGFLVKARDGVIENNRIRGANAISVSSELWSESHANAGGHLTIRGNTFVSTLWSAGGLWNSCQVGTVSFEGESYSQRLFPDVTIENNTFEDIRGLNLNIANAKNVIVRNNLFKRSQQIGYDRKTGNKCSIPKTSVIHVRHSQNVTFSGNRIDRIGPFSVRQVTVDPASTSGITGLPDGVRVVDEYSPVDAAKTYTLTNRNSGQLLTAAATTADSGGATQQKAALQATQGWRFIPAGDSAVRIQNPKTELFLTAGTASTVTMQRRLEDPAQSWRLLDTGNGTVKISNLKTRLFLDIVSAAETPGAAAVQNTADGYLNQSWQLTDASPTWKNSSPSGLGRAGEQYAYQFLAQSPEPLRYTVSSGALPPGTTLDATGKLSGHPVKPGWYAFTVTADNGYATAATSTISVLVRQDTSSAGCPRQPAKAAACRAGR
jgi:hypothetical protein